MPYAWQRKTPSKRSFSVDVIQGVESEDALEVVCKIERRGALTAAEKCRTWLNQLSDTR